MVSSLRVTQRLDRRGEEQLKLKQFVIVAVTALTVLGGCVQQGVRPDARMSSAEYQFMQICMQRQTSNRTTGTVVGGLGGAGAGLMVDGDKRARGALIGGLLGAAGGYFVGRTLDQRACEVEWLVEQNEQLRGQVTVLKDERNHAIMLTGSSDVTFDVNSDRVKPAFTQLLNGVGRMLDRDRGMAAHVVGHTDSTGPAAYNMDLSNRRAYSVAHVLMGYSRAVSYEGRGEEFPVATNATFEGRAANRRVEIELSVPRT